MRMTASELESSLSKLLSTLKNNRDHVPIEVLKTRYKEAYESLIRQINETATDYAKRIVCDGLPLNPYLPFDEQFRTINQTILESGMVKEMGRVLYATYDAQALRQAALLLRKKVEDALTPYIAQEDCLVGDLNDIAKTPVIYNTITKKTYENGAWIDREIDLQGKFLLYIRHKHGAGAAPAGKETHNEPLSAPALYHPPAAGGY